jgi:spore coat protein U-like protein
MRRILRILTGVAGLAISAGAGAANCNVSAIGVAFGSYNVFSSTATDITGSVSVTCNRTTPYTIALSTGSGTYSSRSLKNGTNVLSYNLFVDVTRLTIWGDGSGGTQTVSGSSTNATFTVYGRIAARQNVKVGAYTDSITVTVTY